MKNVLITILLLSLLSACAEEEAPIEVEMYENTYGGYDAIQPEIKIISLVDEIEITHMEVNRGNCKSFISSISALPTTLGYGGTVSVHYSPPCNVLQVDITTSQGDWAFSFK